PGHQPTRPDLPAKHAGRQTVSQCPKVLSQLYRNTRLPPHRSPDQWSEPRMSRPPVPRPRNTTDNIQTRPPYNLPSFPPCCRKTRQSLPQPYCTPAILCTGETGSPCPDPQSQWFLSPEPHIHFPP